MQPYQVVHWGTLPERVLFCKDAVAGDRVLITTDLNGVTCSRCIQRRIKNIREEHEKKNKEETVRKRKQIQETVFRGLRSRAELQKELEAVKKAEEKNERRHQRYATVPTYMHSEGAIPYVGMAEGYSECNKGIVDRAVDQYESSRVGVDCDEWELNLLCRKFDRAGPGADLWARYFWDYENEASPVKGKK